MEHTNKIAIRILRSEYSDYENNSWHYDRQYKMLVAAQDMLLNAIKDGFITETKR